MELIPNSTLNKSIRLILSSIPIIPGPEIYDLFDDLKKSKKSVNQKIEKAYSSLKETSELVDELHTELEERTNKVKELKEKYDRFSKLAEVEEEKIKPLLKEIENSLVKGKKAERVIGFLLNLLAGILIFTLGIWLGPKITKSFQSDDKPKIENQSTEIDKTEDLIKNDTIKKELKTVTNK